ncbi:uncharacterized protein TNCV_4815681 [Trichonephila clavipes]|nr:uncharacterized protein TNCV_4815681 [Trichonephila clavipes]
MANCPSYPKSDTVEELIDRATSLDAIQSVKQENKKQSSRPQLRSFSTHDVYLHKYNSTTDNFKILITGDVDAKVMPPPRGSSVVLPSQFQEPSSQANAPLLSSSGSINHENNTQRGTTNLNSSDSRRNSNSNRNSTSGRNATTNPSNSVNCIKTQTNKRALIPVVINNSIEIQALCDACGDITIIQQSCIPADAVIHPWTDGQFQVVDHKINPIGWISLNLSVGKIVNTYNAQRMNLYPSSISSYSGI